MYVKAACVLMHFSTLDILYCKHTVSPQLLWGEKHTDYLRTCVDGSLETGYSFKGTHDTYALWGSIGNNIHLELYFRCIAMVIPGHVERLAVF